jgi:dipeptidyl aminopeptidase/acylaminoacyl peptidase
MTAVVSTDPSPASTETDALSLSVARMARVGSCHSPSFSPDGSRIAFISDLNGIPQVWTVAASGGWPELVTGLSDQLSSVFWSPTGEKLAYMLSPGGGLNQQIYLVRPDGTDLQRLTDGGRENNWLAGWTRDGSAILYSSNRRSAGGMDVYRMDIESGEPQLLAKNEGISRIKDCSRDGRFVLVAQVINRGDSDFYLVDTKSGNQTLLTPHTGPCSFSGAAFSPDSRTVYLLSNKDRERSALARIRLDEQYQPGEIEVILARDDAEAQEFVLTDDGGMLALVWNVAGCNELVFVDTATGQVTPGPVLPAELAGGLAFSRDGKKLALTVSGSTAPADIWVWTRETGQLEQITHSPHPGTVLKELVRPTAVTFAAHDGLQLSGWLYRPHGASAPSPLVLSFHGGPEGQERPYFSTLYQGLLGQGIVVFAPNVRGSSGFGKTFVNLDNGALRVNAVADIKACVDYVVSAGIAIPERIAIMGGSYGGYMTMAGLTEYPELFAAGANLFGIVNFETFFQHTEPWMAAISKVEYGDPDSEAEMLRNLSPIHRLANVRAATIVLHGANDTNVPVIEAEQVVANLRERGVPVEYILFPDEGHGFRKASNRVRADVAIVRWFAQYL